MLHGTFFFLPGGRVGRVCPDRPGLQPTTLRPGAADPHRLPDSPSAFCQRGAVSAGASSGPRISAGTEEIASGAFELLQRWVPEFLTPPGAAQAGVF